MVQACVEDNFEESFFSGDQTQAIRLAWQVSLMLRSLPVHSRAYSVTQGCLRVQECHSYLDSGETDTGKGLQPHVDSLTYLRDTGPTLTTSSAQSAGSGIVGVNDLTSSGSRHFLCV